MIGYLSHQFLRSRFAGIYVYLFISSCMDKNFIWQYLKCNELIMKTWKNEHTQNQLIRKWQQFMELEFIIEAFLFVVLSIFVMRLSVCFVCMVSSIRGISIYLKSYYFISTMNKHIFFCFLLKSKSQHPLHPIEVILGRLWHIL